MSEFIGGLWVALATPLTVSGDIDHAAFATHANNLLTRGCDGVVLFGTTGEGTSFAGDERLAATEALLAAGIPAARIAVGTGSPSTRETVALTRGMLALDVRHVLLLPPFFYRGVDSIGIEAAFASVIDGVNDDRLRATLYHIPQVSGVAVPPAALANLRARYGVVLAGVKDSSGNFADFQAFRAACPDAAVTIGNEADIGRALAEGGTGTICGLGNLVPDLVRAMFTDGGAVEPMRRVMALISDPFVPVVKSALAALTGEPAFDRLRAPLRTVDPAIGRRIADAIRAGAASRVAA
jgi:4-hydroxy-tetrahydrodipicolinate synthase